MAFAPIKRWKLPYITRWESFQNRNPPIISADEVKKGPQYSYRGTTDARTNPGFSAASGNGPQEQAMHPQHSLECHPQLFPLSGRAAISVLGTGSKGAQRALQTHGKSRNPTLGVQRDPSGAERN